MRVLVTTLLEIAGIALVVGGAFVLHWAAGLIAVGLLLIAVGER